MKIKIKLVIAALLSLGSVIAENVIHDDTLLITEKERVNGLDHYGVASLVGQDGKLGHPAFTNFEYVLGSPISITGDLDTVNWGIACVDTKDKYENSCIVRDDKEYQDYHYANEYTYKQADVYLKSSFDAVLEMSKVSKLPIRVVTGGQKWAGGSMGQFGLSPNGDYIKYNRDLFDIDTSLTLFYSIKDKTKNNEDLSFNTAIVVNANIEKDKIALEEKLDKDSDFWTIPAQTEIGSIGWKVDKTNLCLTSTATELILVTDAKYICDKIRDKACSDRKAGEACQKKNADLSKLDDLVIKSNNTEFTFTTDEYLFFDKDNNLNCRFGDLSNLQHRHVCASNSNIAVGRLFMEKYTLLLFIKKNGENWIYFIKDYSLPTLVNNILLAVRIVFVGIAFIALLWLLIFRKKLEHANDQYDKIEA